VLIGCLCWALRCFGLFVEAVVEGEEEDSGVFEVGAEVDDDVVVFVELVVAADGEVAGIDGLLGDFEVDLLYGAAVDGDGAAHGALGVPIGGAQPDAGVVSIDLALPTSAGVVDLSFEATVEGVAEVGVDVVTVEGHEEVLIAGGEDHAHAGGHAFKAAVCLKCVFVATEIDAGIDFGGVVDVAKQSVDIEEGKDPGVQAHGCSVHGGADIKGEIVINGLDRVVVDAGGYGTDFNVAVDVVVGE